MEELLIKPVKKSIDKTVDLPGSKSQANRAVLCAGLASGNSKISRFLFSDDTNAMIECLQKLNIEVTQNREAGTIEVHGNSGLPQTSDFVSLDANQSGTTARFLLPLIAASSGKYELTGHKQLRSRPFDVLVSTLSEMGADIKGDRLPITVNGRNDLKDNCKIVGNVSSQFISGLMMVAPYLPNGLNIHVTSGLVSKPYIKLTQQVMSSFGVTIDDNKENSVISVSPNNYQSNDLILEPDASAASYFFAAAVITKGRVSVPDLGKKTVQGDVRFVNVLKQMGAKVNFEEDCITVEAGKKLNGVVVDMSDISDTAPTLAIVASFADSPTKITGIGFIRNKETDRIKAVVEQLNNLGIQAEENNDGMTIYPGKPKPGSVLTYQDHRIAMSFALLGLVYPGIKIIDPSCVNKTLPNYFDLLSGL